MTFASEHFGPGIDADTNKQCFRLTEARGRKTNCLKIQKFTVDDIENQSSR